MSIRLDPRRLGTLKQLAGEAGMRPGDLVRTWVEERIDAARQGLAEPSAASDLAARVAALAERVAALEAARQGDGPVATEAPSGAAVGEPEPNAAATPDLAAGPDEVAAPEAPRRPGRPRKRVSRTPAAERVALHDEMIAVLAERGPMAAADLAAAIVERGRYAPPRSGKPLDAAMVSQRVSNPAYRSRFTRDGGRIGLAEQG